MGREAEELFRSLQERLEGDHDAHCQEMRRIQAEFAAESSRLQSQVADLNGRIEQLDEAARRLESDLERRLAQMATDTVSTARTQLESAVETVLNDLGTRNSRELQNQLDHACARLKHVQRETEVSVAESVKNHIAAGVETFEHTIEDVGRHAVAGWRTALANRLNSLARVLGEQFPMEAKMDSNSDRE
jgi:chromosome segregation ATPase